MKDQSFEEDSSHRATKPDETSRRLPKVKEAPPPDDDNHSTDSNSAAADDADHRRRKRKIFGHFRKDKSKHS